MKYLFSVLNELKERLKGKLVFLMLDYDGTLAPIARTPQEAAVPERVKNVLKKLSEDPGYKIAVISGRSLDDLKKRLALKNIIYAGNHGLELWGPKIKFTNTVSDSYRGLLKRIKNELSKKLSQIKGALLEDKGLTLSLHYRLVKDKEAPLVKNIFYNVIASCGAENKVKIGTGKMVLEVRPRSEWDKGKISLWLLYRQKFAVRNKGVFPVFIGDDVTDEDAFVALRRKGATVLVGENKNSCAQYYLKGPQDVLNFLEYLLTAKEIVS